VNEKKLREWDNLAKELGVSRTAMIHNAINIYRLFIEKKLDSKQKEAIEDKLESIEALLEGLIAKRKLIEKEDERDVNEVKELEKPTIKDYDTIQNDIIKLLRSWGSLSEETIRSHLHYPGYLIWVVLTKMKKEKIVYIRNGEWDLYDEYK
jgi:hypothetical protein